MLTWNGACGSGLVSPRSVGVDELYVDLIRVTAGLRFILIANRFVAVVANPCHKRGNMAHKLILLFATSYFSSRLFSQFVYIFNLNALNWLRRFEISY